MLASTARAKSLRTAAQPAINKEVEADRWWYTVAIPAIEAATEIPGCWMVKLERPDCYWHALQVARKNGYEADLKDNYIVISW